AVGQAVLVPNREHQRVVRAVVRRADPLLNHAGAIRALVADAVAEPLGNGRRLDLGIFILRILGPEGYADVVVAADAGADRVGGVRAGLQHLPVLAGAVDAEVDPLRHGHVVHQLEIPALPVAVAGSRPAVERPSVHGPGPGTVGLPFERIRFPRAFGQRRRSEERRVGGVWGPRCAGAQRAT